MQNALMNLVYRDKPVRYVIRGGEPWFIAADVCRVLELVGDAGQHIRRLDEDERTLISNQGNAGERQMWAVNEPGLYALILGSRKPEAKEFKRWITHEVLPSIRKDGLYITPEMLFNPEHLLRVTQRLVEEHEARLAAEAQVQSLAPKAEFYDRVAGSQDAQGIRDVAKVLGTGQNRMFAWLRGQGILMVDNRPYQEYLDRGYFRVIEQTWKDRDGNEHLTTKTLVTGKGLTWLQKRFQCQTDGPAELHLVR